MFWLHGVVAKTPIYLGFPPPPTPFLFGTVFSEFIWQAVSQPWSPKNVPWIKHNSQLLCHEFFLVDSYGDHKGLRADFSPLPELNEDPEPWYQQRSLMPTCLLRESRRIGESFLVLGSPNFWLMILSFIWQCLTGTWLASWKILGSDSPLIERYLGSLVEKHWEKMPLNWKILGEPSWNTLGLSLDTELFIFSWRTGKTLLT